MLRRRWSASATPCRSSLSAVVLLLVLPRCLLSARAEKNIEDYYSATVNATVLDLKGNPKQMLTKDDGRYGQNSPKTEAKGIVIAPAAPANGGKLLIF